MRQPRGAKRGNHRLRFTGVVTDDETGEQRGVGTSDRRLGSVSQRGSHTRRRAVQPRAVAPVPYRVEVETTDDVTNLGPPRMRGQQPPRSLDEDLLAGLAIDEASARRT